MIENKRLWNKWPYLVTVLIVVIVLMVIYREADITKPLVYQNGDEMGVFYTIKSIKNGWYLSNPQVGGITGGDMYDYPYSDCMSFAIIKIISLFFSNIYLIGNVFYFLMYILAAVTSIYVCRRLEYNNFTGLLVSVLYAFSPYIQLRYAHMWLMPYFMMPLACMVAIWIVDGEFNKAEVPWWRSKRHCQAIIISFACAFTGLYYAFFTCCVYMAAFVIYFINSDIKVKKRDFYPLLCILTVVFGVFVQVIPNLLYWVKNGINGNSELSIRVIGEAEQFGLKIIQLLLPRQGHRISCLNGLTEKYILNYPLVNENLTSAMGMIASIGLILSLIWLFSGKPQKTLSYLNISLILIGTVGGIGSIFSLLIRTPMRAYNRISVMIMFISLLCVAGLLEKLQKKCTDKQFGLFVIMLLAIGIFDQTVDYKTSSIQVTDFESTQKFVADIEGLMDENDLIFQLPYVNWPTGGNYRMFSGYLNSENLRWSYGCMQGREEALWQTQIAESDLNTMLKSLAINGYKGLYLDAVVYASMKGEDELQSFINEVTMHLKESPIISANGELYYWSMAKYNKFILSQVSNPDM